jgi:hypothetical protein
MLHKLNRLLSNLEWRLSLGSLIWGVLFPAGSFVVPAWAARAAGILSQYSPLSWVVAGGCGVLLYGSCIFLIGVGRSLSVRAQYDARFMAESGGVDPLARVFESKRIFLNDFVLPSNPLVEGKTFVNCQIVGPANLFLQIGNSADDIRHGNVDSVVLNGANPFSNGITFRGCAFRGCTFDRVTLFFLPGEAQRFEELNWLNWISYTPAHLALAGQPSLTPIADQLDQSLEVREEPESSVLGG